MRVARLTRIRDHQQGDVIVHEGAKGRDLYIILDGEVTVSRDDREVAVLRAGDFFRELALFDPAPRNATV